MEGLNPLGGRFQTRHTFLHDTTIDVKGTVASDLLVIPVVFDKIEILEFGLEYMTATGAFSVAAVLRLSKIPYQNGSRVNPVNANAILTMVASQVIYSKAVANLDLYATAVAPAPTAGPATYPTAVRGDVLIVELVTPGTGTGSQDVRPWVVYRERPLV